MERETKTIASNLKRLIYETGLSPAEVARQIWMSKATLSRWMTGDSKTIPSKSTNAVSMRPPGFHTNGVAVSILQILKKLHR